MSSLLYVALVVGQLRGEAPATLQIDVLPTSAVTYIDGDPMISSGRHRTGETPPLPYGREYTYHVTARATINGIPCYASQMVTVRAGETTAVRLRPVAQQTGTERNYGVTPFAPLREGAAIYANGRRITKQEARQLLTGNQADQLADDSRALRVTVIGNQRDRSPVAQDWFGSDLLADARKVAVFASYPADHPMIARYGFKTNGHPTIYIQRPDGFGPDGGDPWRMDEYPGPEALAKAVRKADAAYTGEGDKDPTKPSISAGGLAQIVGTIPLSAGFMGALGLYLLLSGANAAKKVRE